MCWLHRDEMVARLTARRRRRSGCHPQPPSVPAASARWKEKLFALEVEEEHFVAEAIAAVWRCHRRVDANPWAILGWGLRPQAPVAEAAE